MIIINGSISPENMGMDMMILKSSNKEYNESSKVSLL